MSRRERETDRGGEGGEIERERESQQGREGEESVVEGRQEGGAGVEYRAKRKIGPRKWNGRAIGKHKRVVGSAGMQPRSSSRHANNRGTQPRRKAHERARARAPHTYTHTHTRTRVLLRRVDTVN